MGTKNQLFAANSACDKHEQSHNLTSRHIVDIYHFANLISRKIVQLQIIVNVQVDELPAKTAVSSEREQSVLILLQYGAPDQIYLCYTYSRQN